MVANHKQAHGRTRTNRGIGCTRCDFGSRVELDGYRRGTHRILKRTSITQSYFARNAVAIFRSFRIGSVSIKPILQSIIQIPAILAQITRIGIARHIQFEPVRFVGTENGITHNYRMAQLTCINRNRYLAEYRIHPIEHFDDIFGFSYRTHRRENVGVGRNKVCIDRRGIERNRLPRESIVARTAVRFKRQTNRIVFANREFSILRKHTQRTALQAYLMGMATRTAMNIGSGKRVIYWTLDRLGGCR